MKRLGQRQRQAWGGGGILSAGQPLRLGSSHAFLEQIYQAAALPAVVKGH